jgi:serine/threonine-protein kinase
MRARDRTKFCFLEDTAVNQGQPNVPDGGRDPTAAGSVNGDYELLEVIAQGGMGTVYKALHLRLGQTVALKVIRSGQFASHEDVQRFRLEAEAAAQLDHPNVVPVYEVGVLDLEGTAHSFYTMKLIEGEDLTRHVSRLQGDPRAAAGLLVALARAVHHAHQRGILHRDLKPANVLLDQQLHPYLADFGLARRLATFAEPSGLTRTGDLLGTPSYLAPEQAAGEKARLSTATDVYGLGPSSTSC